MRTLKNNLKRKIFRRLERLQKYSNRYIQEVNETWEDLIFDLKNEFKIPNSFDMDFERKMDLYRRSNEVISLINNYKTIK